jgi:hypothetical protein
MTPEGSTYERARRALGAPRPLEDPFGLLRDITEVAATEGGEAARDLLIRVLERRVELSAHEELLSALLAQQGLFPYVQPISLGARQAVAYEAHRPLHFPDGSVVFQQVQAEVYRELMEGRSVVLSAPTSFGKSLILDALVASGHFDNVVVLVPTLALMDETRRRLTRFESTHKLITHPSQALAARNVLVMTQERLLEVDRLPRLDLFMIDEFYKLSPTRDDVDRSTLLNAAFYRLHKTGAPHYLAGPDIDRLAAGLPQRLGRFLRTDYSTVVSDVTEMAVAESDIESVLRTLVLSLTGPTLLYCRSVPRVRAVARWLMSDRQADSARGAAIELAQWMEEHYHRGWLVPRALRAGVGIHHARLPRSVGQQVVQAFNDGDLDLLVCTSTLIEGVNTRAKNVVIVDNKIANRLFDYFTWNNIRGRAGRMGRHFVGRVYSLQDRPAADLPEVDVPALTQPETTPLSLLLQMDSEDLTPQSTERLQPVLEQDVLDVAVLRANRGMDPLGQIALAQELLGDRAVARQVSWRGFPTHGELTATLDLALRHLAPTQWRSHGALSASQLALFLGDVSRGNGDIRGLVGRLLDSDSPDDAVEKALDFVRFWPGHHLPRLLRVIASITAEVLPRLGLPRGEYDVYAAAAERLFLPPYLADLEEYGLPAQVSMKLGAAMRGLRDLDEALEVLRTVPVPDGLTAYEQRLLARSRPGAAGQALD